MSHLAYEIARQVIKEYLKDGKDFTYKDLCASIRSRGGIMRVHFGLTINDYLTILEEQDTIAYSPKKDIFSVNFLPDQHLVARGVIGRYLRKKKTFSLKEVVRTIIKEGGIALVSTGVSISDYLKDLKEAGIVSYDGVHDTYQVVVKKKPRG